MIDIDDFSNAVAQIYDASLSTDRWVSVLDTLARLFGGQMAQMSYFDSFAEATPLFWFWGFDMAVLEGLMAKYREFSFTDPRTPPRLFKAYHCREIVSDEAMRSTEMYRQVLAPSQVEYSMFFVLNLSGDLNLSDAANCSVSVMRGPDFAPFTAEDCADFGRFAAHIGRAITLHGTVRHAHEVAAAAQGLIDQMPMGMIVLNDERIVLANTAAAALLDQGDALRRVGGRLQAQTAQGHAQLVLALRQARDGDDEPIGVTFPAGDTGSVRAVIRRLEPLSAERLGAGSSAVALYLTDSRSPIETDEEVLRRLFGLTEREAMVLRALVQGDDTRGIARRLGIGVETVKTHLTHVMQTLGVRRQTELVRLVLSSPAWIGAAHVAPALNDMRRGRAALPSGPRRPAK